jgi:hypothetical protein
MWLTRQYIEELPLAIGEYVNTHALGFTMYQLELKYDYWNASTLSIIHEAFPILMRIGEILQALLPEELCKGGVPTSFTHTGHIGMFKM